MVDKVIIKRKISFMDQKLKKLNTIKLMERQDFLASFQAVDAAKYNLQVCIEAMLDISNHLVARERWGIPKSAVEAIRLLIHNGVLAEEMEPSLRQMVKFRRRIVYLYQDVSDVEIYRILQENLTDLAAFMRAVISKYF